MSNNAPAPKFSLNTDATDPLAGYEIVARLLSQQDTVIEELDRLNDRIELAIQEITAARQAELIALDERDDESDDPAKRILKAA